MKVGFDAKKAIRNHTGIGNYSRRCIRAVEETGAETEPFGAEALPHAAASAKQLMTIPIAMRRKSGLFILWWAISDFMKRTSLSHAPATILRMLSQSAHL